MTCLPCALIGGGVVTLALVALALAFCGGQVG